MPKRDSSVTLLYDGMSTSRAGRRGPTFRQTAKAEAEEQKRKAELAAKWAAERAELLARPMPPDWPTCFVAQPDQR